MKIYFAGAGIPKADMLAFRKAKLETGEVFRFLHSYLEIKNGRYDLLKNYLPNPDQAFLDSGAYTAMTLGTVINIDDYIRTIKESEVTIYAGLDVIGDWKKTKENIEYMEAQGLKPIPTFHYASPIEELKRMIEKYDYIALGGLVPIAMERNKFKAWCDYCFGIIGTDTKIHGFGVNSYWAWQRYPWYSVDATSWVTGSKFRRIVKFKGGKLHTYQKNEKLNIGTMQVYSGDYSVLNQMNMEEYNKAAEFITYYWKRRGVNWDV